MEEANKKVVNGFIALKTVGKSILNKIGIDLNITDEDLERIYSSIDLSKVLIVLEDLERTQINICSLLGFVNNMTEHDGAKVLLVTNEKELLKIEKGTENNQKGNYTEETISYLREKEKTVSDTLNFTSNLDSTLIDILNLYDNTLSRYSNQKSIENIKDAMCLCSNYNLRAFCYACQKISEIISNISKNYSQDFYDCIFYGVLAFVLRAKQGNEYNWRYGDYLSGELGVGKYPLFKFCYDYITKQEINNGDIEGANYRLEIIRLYDKDKSKNDKDLNNIYNYFVKSETNVRKSVRSIEKRLNDINDISLYEYGKIAVYMVAISNLLEIDISKIKELLVCNLRGRGDIIQGDILFSSTLMYENDKLLKEYNDLKNKMYESLNYNGNNIDYDYKPNDVNELKKYIKGHKEQISIMGEFASKLNIQHMVNLFFECSAKQMNEYRDVFLNVYQYNENMVDFRKDKQALMLLLEGIKNSENVNKIDKIQWQQYMWFIGNLESFIQKMN